MIQLLQSLRVQNRLTVTRSKLGRNYSNALLLGKLKQLLNRLEELEGRAGLNWRTTGPFITRLASRNVIATFDQQALRLQHRPVLAGTIHRTLVDAIWLAKGVRLKR